MNKKLLLTLCVAGVAVVDVRAAVTTLSVSAPDAHGAVTVTYALDADAIVTCEMLVDGAPVAEEALVTLAGDVNRKIAAGTGRTIVWQPVLAGLTASGAVSARLTAWPLDNPPDYMAIDLTLRNSRRYFASAAQVPYGVTNDIYKTDILLMRKIPAVGVTWRMGQPVGGENCSSGTGSGHTKADILDNETGHMVRLTNDFYAAVFMTTQYQYWRMKGTKAATSSTYSGINRDFVPLDYITYDVLRGAADASFLSWPRAGHAVKDGSVLRTFRDFTGIESLDLPTEAEWEYACRAGTASALNNGKECSSPISGRADANMAEVGWMQYNPPLKNTPLPVGLLKPNNWGLYDCHGNVCEWCLDWWCGGEDYRDTFVSDWESGGVTVAPDGPVNAGGELTRRVARGGNHFYGSSWARSASRRIRYEPAVADHCGFRLFCRIDTEAN